MSKLVSKAFGVPVVVLVVLLLTTPLAAQVVINEIDYDQDSTDTAEFVELKNTGLAAENLDLYTLELVNGNGGGAAVYNTIDLPNVNLAPGDYYVICANAATVANCDLDAAPDTNFIQNGAPDAVGLRLMGSLVDAVSYEGDTGAPYTEGSGAGLVDDPSVTDAGLSRCADGTDTDQNNVDFAFTGITPGAANVCPGPTLVINEIDYDQAGTDTAEFVEIKNVGPSPVALGGIDLLLVNGSGGGAVVYDSIPLPSVSLAAGDYFVVCANAATVANCDLDDGPDTNFIQNGAPDAVALVQGATVIDTVSYEGNTGAPYTEGSGSGLEDDASAADSGISRCPDGTDTGVNNLDLIFAGITPGASNDCGGGGASLVINEIDYDQPDTDAAEFIEIKNVGTTAVDLGTISLELVNGSGGGAAVYNTIALPSVSLAAGDYFVVCANAATVANCDLDVAPDTNLIQNGAPDAVALLQGTTILDTVSYEGDTAAPYTEGSGSGLEDPGSGGVGGGNDNKGISRFPDGIDTDVNNSDLSMRCITPGTANSAAASDCPAPGPPSLVVNEIDYDQPGTDTAEFIEIKNVGTTAVDLGTISLELVNGNGGGAVVYGTIALPSVSLAAGDYFVVCANAATVANCDLDVAPDTNLIQNGAPDAVALLQGTTILDTVSYEGDTAAPYTEGSGSGLEDSGAAGEDNKGISRYSDGVDTDSNNVDLVFSCITPGGANTNLSVNCSPNGPVLEIFEIQGSGLASPFDGSIVITEDNVVTSLSPNGFFMQTPASRSDGDIATSDGIFVFTGGAPGVAVGDLVDVFGPVQEFFDFTEFGGGSTVTVTGTEVTPAPVVFDATVPSPDPTTPSCGSFEYECYEGMLIEIVDGTVTGPNQRFNPDPIAEVHITAAPARTFREPGIEFPGIPPFPEWDGNPEVFELDPDKLGLANQVIPAGSSFSATGVLGFEFGGYELWPNELTVTPAPLPVPVRAREAGEFTVGTLNLFRLFDDVDDPADGDRDDFVVSTAEYQRRLAKFSAYVLDVLDAPDILAVQEVESLSVLEDLAAKLFADSVGAVDYSASLIEGNDVGTIDVGFLTRQKIQVDAVTQVDPDVTFLNPVTNEQDILHDRPPLVLEGRCQLEFGSYPIAVMAVHNRSLGSIEDPIQGIRVRAKRFLQAVSIAEEVAARQAADPDLRLVVTGDFNAFEFTDGFVDAVGVITGDFVPGDNLVCDERDCSGLPDDNLVNEVLRLDAAERYSFIFRGSAQVLDHALTSVGLAGEVSGVAYGRGNADAAVDLINDDGSIEPGNLPLRSSDHDGLVLYVVKDEDADGVPNDNDVCAGTVIPEAVPTVELKTNRWALVDADGIFDTNPPNGNGPGFGFDLGDTAGCSCEQIIAALGLGQGHTKHGCSNGAMLNWVDLVSSTE